jgi:hypothetical protein
MTGGLLRTLPLGLQALAGPILTQLPITPFNLVCTNMPGPQFPLYLLGHKMVRCYPYPPVDGETAANCAILSYDGTLYFGFSGDMHASPDLQRLEKFLKLSFFFGIRAINPAHNSKGSTLIPRNFLDHQGYS